MTSLTEIRKSYSLSIEELATNTELSVLGIKKIEKGIVKNPYDSIRNKIELALNQRVDWVLTCQLKDVKKQSWYPVERQFRKALMLVNGLSELEQKQILSVMASYIESFSKLLVEKKANNEDIRIPGEFYSSMTINRKRKTLTK
jgi:transcriptional regulator with XRE-family HTH domain